jgi:hypothetical protein
MYFAILYECFRSNKNHKTEDLPASPQLLFTLNNRFFRHQACYSLLPAKPGGQADRVISLCKYKVVVQDKRGRGVEGKIRLIDVNSKCQTSKKDDLYIKGLCGRCLYV